MDNYLTELKKKFEKINPFKKKIIEGATGDKEEEKEDGAKVKCELNDEAKYDGKEKK